LPTQYRSSYWKTTVLAAASAFAAALATVGALLALPAPAGPILGTVFGVAAIAALVFTTFGLVVQRREARTVAGQADLFLELNQPRREAALAAPTGFRAGFLRRLTGRLLLGHGFLVGDEVVVRPLAEILATLDADGRLDGIPFQREMARFSGQRVRVFRVLDKIYDYGRTRRMRRLDGFVLLSGLRCDGTDHGGCQARCYLLWNVKWLQRAGAKTSAEPAGVAAPVPAPELRAQTAAAATGIYECQFTRLHAATRQLPVWGIGKELRPLVAGNFSLGAWYVGLATRGFNNVQRLRGGVGFPIIPLPPEKPGAAEAPHLNEGDQVVVAPIEAIARTLNRAYKNRGLWFDRDMVKHCGKRYRVLARVDRIIDDATGEMRTMKTPCVLLDGADYSGEFLNFNVQHDPFFWREAWLERAQ
jgi:hypothetical protein